MAAVLEFLEYPERAAELLHRVPNSGQVTLRAGAQCRVGPHQAAVFYGDGPAADVLHAGKHALTAATLPALASRAHTGGDPDRFRAAVYFVSDRVVSAMEWALPGPVTVVDDRGRSLTLSARGTASFRISNAGAFVGMHVASKYPASTRGVMRNVERRIAGEVAAVLERDFRSWEALPARFNEIATESRLRIRHALGRDGIELVDCFITAIDPLQRPASDASESPVIRQPRLHLGDPRGGSPPVSPPAAASGVRRPRRRKP